MSKNISWLLVIALFGELVAGCASPPPKPPDYRRYTLEIFPPKPVDYSMPVLHERPSGDYVMIGRYLCDNSAFLHEIPVAERLDYIMEMAKRKARREGADAILIWELGTHFQDYCYDIKKCDPPSPPTPPDKNDSKKKKDRATDNPSNNSGPPSPPNMHTETISGRNYSFVFDVDFIAYKKSRPKG